MSRFPRIVMNTEIQSPLRKDIQDLLAIDGIGLRLFLDLRYLDSAAALHTPSVKIWDARPLDARRFGGCQRHACNDLG
jgi:hypothetical protein